MGYLAVEEAVAALSSGSALLVELPDRGVLVAVKGSPGARLVDLHATAVGTVPWEATADPAGVLARPTAAAVALDLLRLARFGDAAPLAVRFGDLAGVPRRAPLPAVLARFAADHDLPLVSLDDLVHHRRRFDHLVDEVAVASLPLPAGTFRTHAYRSLVNGSEHLALVLGEIEGGEDVLCRVHSECLTGDVFASRRCDCGEQLEAAFAAIAAAGRGVIVYLRGHEGRGIGLAEKLRAYALQEQGLDTVDANVALGHPADGRDFADAAQILRLLGPASVRLLTNNPAKIARLEALGVAVSGRQPVEIAPNPHNAAYLDTKRRRFGHLL